MAGDPPMLVLNGLRCERGGRALFAGLSLALAPGEALLLRGANGTGKSSLLRQLAGLLEAAPGMIRRATRLAYLGHDNGLKREESVRQSLSFWQAVQGGGAFEPALAQLGLTDLIDIPVRLLSQGQKRRVALARVLASGAPLWLLDEPTVGLDAGSVAALAAAMRAHRAHGGAIVAATHIDVGLEGARVLELGA
jgi:heme exporter protein A